LDSIEFSVDGFPPAYDSALSISNKNHKRYPLVVKLQEVARAAMNGNELIQGDLKMEVKCEATLEHMGTDCINLIGGIGNSLQGVIYSNDNQIKGIHFKQLLSNQNRYTIRISKVGHY
jgi:Holliday junction resolvase RusA-like endonuclease